MRLTKSQKKDLQKITDLCCCVNAFDGYCMDQPVDHAKRLQKVWDRQRKALTDTIKTEIMDLVLLGVHVKHLNKAMHDAGWDDNYFSVETNTIEYKV